MGHLAGLEDIETQQEKPVGALILSVQAVRPAITSWTGVLIPAQQVGRALGFFKTGKFMMDSSAAHHFSADNYSDRVQHIEVRGARGRYRKIKEKRATAFIPSVKAFDEGRWTKILAEAREYLPERKKSHARSTSYGSSEVEVEIEEDIMLISDED